MSNHFFVLPPSNDNSTIWGNLAKKDEQVFTILEPICSNDQTATTIAKRRIVADQVNKVVESKKLQAESIYLILHGSDIVANGERVKGRLYVEQSDPLSSYSGRIYAFHRNGPGVIVYNHIIGWNGQDSSELCGILIDCITKNIR